MKVQEIILYRTLAIQWSLYPTSHTDSNVHCIYQGWPLEVLREEVRGVTQYQPSVPSLKNILMKHWQLIEKQPLLRQIYKAKVVTQFGVIQGYIATSRLQPCTATGVKLNYDKEISFSSACKEAHNSN